MIETLEKKINELRLLDEGLAIFGSSDHKYNFKSIVTEDDLTSFERSHGIILPDFYRRFILHFGSEGCGPNYGLINLDHGKLDLPHRSHDAETIKMSCDFRFTSFWNMSYSEGDYIKWEKEYFHAKWLDGCLRISHEGCGFYANIVVTGSEKGNVWIDGRASDAGIYPVGYRDGKLKTSFFEWYNDWLDRSLEKIKSS